MKSRISDLVLKISMDTLVNQPLILSYNKLVSSEKIKPDQGQALLAEKLSNLAQKLAKIHKKNKRVVSKILRKKKRSPKGLYIFGDVGRGKSMMMDLFFQNIDSDIPRRRVHFHAFMNEVHNRIFQKRKTSDSNDILKEVAEDIAGEANLLCFDEMQVTDIADAMILGRLFETLFENDVVIVATSNRHPDELYKDGLQRDRFLPFIKIFKDNMDIFELLSPTDYRLQHIRSLNQTYIFPLNKNSQKFIDEVFEKLTNRQNFCSDEIIIKGRKILVPKAYGDIAEFSFSDLCDANLGAEDYIEIARTYSTIILKNVPKLQKDDYNLALRFIKLVDSLYEHKTKLIISAEVDPQKLYEKGEGSFEFSRTVSRLIEMQSEKYLKEQHVN